MKGLARLLTALQQRERSNLAELARASNKLATGRGTLAKLDILVEEMSLRASAGVADSLMGVSRSVAEILEADRHLCGLRQELAKLAAIRLRAVAELDELERHRLQAEDRWQRSRVRFQHVQSLARRRAVLKSARCMDAEEMEHADRRVFVRGAI